MSFVPATVALHEAGPDAPYQWCMDQPLAWSGPSRSITVPASAAQPFVTDLASVPRCFTWLFPRYGKYTKAAIVHDFLCQSFARPSASPVVADRSDADEVFLHLMDELGVPWLRRRLLWGAVCWATMFSTAAIGRQRAPVSRSVARAILVVALLAGLVLLVARHDRVAVGVVVVAAPVALVVAGVIALGRPDRIADYVLVDVLTLLFLPMLALGGVLAVVTFLYLAIEDVCAGLPTLRRLWANLTSPTAKLQQLASPQFARLAAISES